MKELVLYLLCVALTVECGYYDNYTNEPADEQLLDFKINNPLPIGLRTKSGGNPTLIRETISVNSNMLNNPSFVDTLITFDGERIPERVAHAKGGGAFGYFEVTHDVSKYTYADVFNGIGKITPTVVRFSLQLQNHGGNDLSREARGMAIKFYTREGNLDITCLQTPVYLYKDPQYFPEVIHALKRNPQTFLFDWTARWDLITLRPALLFNFFYQFADCGIPDGYRKMDAFAIHTYELANKHGESHYVRFNFRSEQGFSALTTAQAAAIQSRDLDYFNRDLFNAIAKGNFPAWRLEMDVMTSRDIQTVDYNPFDVTRLWKNGTFFTVQIGRLVLNKNPENYFRDVEQTMFDPGSLVGGIPGPADFLFTGRRLSYRDSQNHRLGRNHNNILVNRPLYAKTYNRDGQPPTYRNGQNAPNYYPNSFNGPIPDVDENQPEILSVIESTAVDLEPLSEFYNHILEGDGHRHRFVDNIVLSLVPVTPNVVNRAMKLLSLVDKELGKRVALGYEEAMEKKIANHAFDKIHPTPSSRNIPSTAPASNYCIQKYSSDDCHSVASVN